MQLVMFLKICRISETILDYFENEALTAGWVSNLQPEKTAQHWIRTGFAPEEAWRYLEARCPVPTKSAELRKIGITPDMAAQHYGYDEDDFPMTLSEALLCQ